MEQRIEFNSLVQIINRTVPGGADALRGHLTQPANHHLVNARDPNPAQQGRTLLHYAVMARNPECTQVLLDCGAKTFISDINFCSPLTYATQNNPNIECLTLLLRNLTTFKSADLDEIITFALEHYKPENDGDNTHNLLVSAFCVSLLTGLNLEPELRDNQNKFFGHICSIKGYYIQGSIAGTAVGPNESNRLEWWHQYQFLSTRLRILFHLLLKMSWNYTHEVENDNRRLRVELVKKEFCITIETFHLLWAAYHIDSLANKINLLRDNVRQIQDSLYIALSKNVIDRIRALENGELVLAVRYVNPGHSIYVAFQKINGIVLKRVDNLGDGVLEMQGARILSWRHATTVDNLIYPFVYSQRQQNEYNETNQDELSYISDCIKFSVLTYEKAQVINRIYSSGLNQGGVRFDQLNLPALYPQALSCNCVVESYLPGTKNRTRENWEWLLGEERTLASPNLTLRVELRYPVTGVQYLQQRKIPVHMLKVFCSYIANKYNTLPSNTREKGFRIENVVFNLRKESTPTFKEEERENERAFFATALANQDQVDIATIISPNDDQSQSVLIEGHAGYGKTTLCLFIMQQWSKVQGRLWEGLDLICYIPLRNLNREKYPPRNTPYTLSEIVHKECFEGIVGNVFINNKLETLLINNKVLWIFDGYDELELPEYLRDVWERMLDLAKCRVVTTRPYKKPEGQFNVTKTIHIAPYRREEIDRFIDNYFVGDQITKRDTLKKFIWGASSIRSNIRTPGNLSMLCLLWSNDPSLLEGDTKIAITQLFYQFLKLSMRLALVRFGVQGVHNHNPAPLFLMSAKVMKCYQRIAYFMKLNNQREITQQTLAKYLGRPVGIDLIGSMREYGFLIQTGALENPLYEFSHSSILDFFCAWYIYQKMSGHHYRDAINLISEKKYDNNFSLVLRFLSGFIHQKLEGLSVADHIINERMKNNFWKVIDSPPRELSNYFHVKLWIALLQETDPEKLEKDFGGRLQTIARVSAYFLRLYYADVGSTEVTMHEFSNELSLTLVESPIVLECLLRTFGFYDGILMNIHYARDRAAAIKVLTRFVGYTSSFNHEAFKKELFNSYRDDSVNIRFSVVDGFLRLAHEGNLSLDDVSRLIPIGEEKYSGRYFKVMKIFSACSKLIASSPELANKVENCIAKEVMLSPLCRTHGAELYSYDSALEAYYNILTELPGEKINGTELIKVWSKVLCMCYQPFCIQFYSETNPIDPVKLDFMKRIFLLLANKNRQDLVVGMFGEIINNKLLPEEPQAAKAVTHNLLACLCLFVQHEKFVAYKKDLVTFFNYLLEGDDNEAISAKIVFFTIYFESPPVGVVYIDCDMNNGMTASRKVTPGLIYNDLSYALRRAAGLDFAYTNLPTKDLVLKAFSKLARRPESDSARVLALDLLRNIDEQIRNLKTFFSMSDITNSLREAFAAYQMPFQEIELPPQFELSRFESTISFLPQQAAPHADTIAVMQKRFDAFIANPNDSKLSCEFIGTINSFVREPVIILTQDTLQFRGFPPLVWPKGERGLTAIHAFLYRCFENSLLKQFLTDDRNQMHITDRINLFIQERVVPGAVVMYEDVTTQWQFFTTVPTPPEEKPAPVAQQELLTNPPGGLK